MMEKIVVFLNAPHVLDFFHVKCDGNKVVDHLANVEENQEARIVEGQLSCFGEYDWGIQFASLATQYAQ